MFVYGIPFVVLVCTQYLQLHIAYKVQISKCNVQHEAGSIAKNKHNNMYKQKKSAKTKKHTGKIHRWSAEWHSVDHLCIFPVCFFVFFFFFLFFFFFCMLFCLFSAGAVNPSALAATMNKLVTLTMPLRTGSHSIQKSLSPL